MILKLVADGEWSPSRTMDERWLDESREVASKYWGEPMPDLTLYFRLRLPPTVAEDAEKMRRLFEILPEVEAAYHVWAPVDLPAPANDFSVGVPNDMLDTPLQYQGYLDSAGDGGVDARFAWNQPGGLGENVNIVDIERGWTLNHEDLPDMPQIGNEIIGIDPVDYDHGNAVMGVIVGLDNGFGGRGIAPLAKPFVKSPGLTNVDENLGGPSSRPRRRWPRAT